MNKLAISVLSLTLGLAAAQAASSTKINLSSNMTVGGTEIKAGEYKVVVDGNTATFKSEKKTFTVPATTETGTEKFRLTMMEADGTNLKAIHVGGTDTTIKFATTTAAAGGN